MAGTFFREKMLKSGTIIPMPDIRDRIASRSFLPRSIQSKLPFSFSKLEEYEQKPNAGETKSCVGSAEDLIDFAVSKLGSSIRTRTTENTNGSGKDVMVGEVRAVDGGKAIDTVSCHQNFYPYLVYLCHALPNAHVYEVDILDLEAKAKINRGSAVCHLDTSSWGSNHQHSGCSGQLLVKLRSVTGYTRMISCGLSMLEQSPALNFSDARMHEHPVLLYIYVWE